MKRTDTIIVGAGQAGLAASRCLTDRGIDHVILERGRIAERWRSERWDSLRLLTPNWQSRLPGFRYEGPDPDGFMSMPEIVRHLERYSLSFAAPVLAETTVLEVAPTSSGFRIVTDRDVWGARAVVVATGHCDLPVVPRAAARMPRRIRQVVPSEYRHPGQLPDGDVLVVGASASGIQIAEEIHRSGRSVTLAVGQHTRVPRRYRGRDIMWWLDRTGILTQTPDQVYDVEISREQPSFQLVGRRDRASVDLVHLRTLGVRVVGRLLHVDGDRVTFDDNLVATTAAADVKLASLLARLDRFAAEVGIGGAVRDREPFTPTWHRFTEAPTSLDLRRDRIRTAVWATGFRRSYPWLKVDVLDARGEIRHTEGVAAHPGLFVIGLHFLRRRNSSFIDGVGADAEVIADRIGHYLGRERRAIA